MEREACVCDHGYERSDLCAEIIIIIIVAVNGHFFMDATAEIERNPASMYHI